MNREEVERWANGVISDMVQLHEDTSTLNLTAQIGGFRERDLDVHIRGFSKSGCKLELLANINLDTGVSEVYGDCLRVVVKGVDVSRYFVFLCLEELVRQ